MIDPRGFATPGNRLDAVAAEIAASRPDAIYCGGDAAGQAVKRATKTIPVVATADDAIRAGIVASLARPGGNITGVSILATELDGKRLSLLIELIPGITRIAVLVDPETTAPAQIEQLLTEARSRGVELSIHRAGTAQEISLAIDAARAEGAQAVDVLASALFNAHRAADDRARQRSAAAGNVPMAGLCRDRRTNLLRPAVHVVFPPSGAAACQGAQWRQAGRYPGRAADRYRARHQSKNGRGSRPDRAAIATRPRR